MPDYYETLGVPRDASADQIKKAFRERAFEFHPDRNPGNPAAEEQFKKINEAYSTLGDQDTRSRYDAGGSSGNPYGAGRQAGNPWGQQYGSGPSGAYPWGEEQTGQYSWTFYGPFGEASSANRAQWNPPSRREAFELLLRSLFTLIIGVALFRFSFILGIFGILLCVTAIGRGLMNSLRAIRLLFSLRK